MASLTYFPYMRRLQLKPTPRCSASTSHSRVAAQRAVALLQSGTDVTVIRDYLGHASVATTGRQITTNLLMKRDAMQSFWKKAGIEPADTKAWKPKADLLLFLQSL